MGNPLQLTGKIEEEKMFLVQVHPVIVPYIQPIQCQTELSHSECYSKHFVNATSLS